MNINLLRNKLLNRCIKRLHRSIPQNIVSNHAKIDLKAHMAEDFSHFIKNNQIKCVNIDYPEENNHLNPDFFFSDVESLNKIFNSHKFPVTFQTVSSDNGDILTKNRITIQHEDDLCEQIKSVIPKECLIYTKLPHRQYHHIYCQTEDQFNSLFFQNGIQKNVSIQKTHFPYIKNLTLKISPNIINVYFHEEIETEEKASNFFSDLRFNKIVKPSNPKVPWKFYLSNEEDYLKMLSQPYFYMNQCLLVLPYYGTPIFLYDGEKKVGNSFLIYSKSKIGKISDENGKSLQSDKSLFENGNIVSFFFNKMALTKFRFLNGSKIEGVEDDYTMIFMDEINKLNLVSPYLHIKTRQNFDLNLIKSKVAPFIYDSKILILNNVKYFIFLPLSFEHYLKLLKFSLKIEGTSIRITPDLNLSRYSYLSNFILVPNNIYDEKKEEIDKSIKPLEIRTTSKGFLLSYKTSEITDALFRLAKCKKLKWHVQRLSKSIIQSEFCLSSNRTINIRGEHLDQADFNYFERKPYNRIKVSENHWMLKFQNIKDSFPYLFHQIIETNNRKVECEISLRVYDSKTTLVSHLSSESTINLLNFYGITYTYSIEVNNGRFHIKIETLDDLYKVVSMVDEFKCTGKPTLEFFPRPELSSL